MTNKNTASGVADIDLPWRKLKRVGPEGMRDDELLAVVLKNGYGSKDALAISDHVVQKHPVGSLVDMDRECLLKIKGVTASQADVLIAAFELTKRGLNEGMGIAPSVTCPADAVGLLADIKDKRKEYFVAIFLNARNQMVCREDVSVGSLNASLVHPREVFMPAVGSSAASVILAHNHPSGDVTPSREDIELTRRMVQAGEIMGIEVVDHLILGAERFISLKESNVF